MVKTSTRPPRKTTWGSSLRLNLTWSSRPMIWLVCSDQLVKLEASDINREPKREWSKSRSTTNLRLRNSLLKWATLMLWRMKSSRWVKCAWTSSSVCFKSRVTSWSTVHSLMRTLNVLRKYSCALTKLINMSSIWMWLICRVKWVTPGSRSQLQVTFK